ncbi:tRNA (adenosine(37)-N6)-threonylcarbamoyltransferase complex transferase subunit TsaD [Patescibacteria group bacterium]|nr:tRNA (adenosine(37)-N6)-threonylcarbamoyltransferase complex transferase subunit TsaD [Patescibacteria group bacterium]MDE1946714.1 tRNA (adenosine(37)-N6)-threonylcarbamoyltransferase complex transferase subunit TsaD [Patescibacteria group bacterium]MDE2010983.1 tRNA (adenosine(37)-N6)-threonylcarbamoyltransferase complex transferase subunit TsaD [Patescibacteria group bacterium]MDE2232825.1 tRNA (adenosine(37)-N6)-threonylcarbamoyltransferase complex transferase subunit TsaD [Patescibacteri
MTTILGIETSCDETALAIIETREAAGKFECRVINSLVHSQAELHSAYGGVYPNLAKREHQKNLPVLLTKLMEPLYGYDFLEKRPGIDRIAVTEGPGLEPALWTGIVFARDLAEKWKVPITPVNHMEGHIVGSLLGSDAPYGTWQELKPLPLPSVALLVSGGHTELVKIESVRGEAGTYVKKNLWKYEILGATRDDAAGEAFDKVARLLGLPYPGGPHISVLAQKAEEEGIEPPVDLPRPMIRNGSLDFSFSGLKTAVLYAIQKAEKTRADADGRLDDDFKKGMALGFERAVTEVLESKTRAAIDQTSAKSLILGGGVSANRLIRERLARLAYSLDIPLFLPSKHISGDNALMIALAGAMRGIEESSGDITAHGTKKLA